MRTSRSSAALLAGLVALLLGGVVLVAGTSFLGQDDASTAPSPAPNSREDSAEATLEARREGKPREQQEAKPASDPRRAARPIGILRGIVEGPSGPAAGARVTARASTGTTPLGMVVDAASDGGRETTTDPQGRFGFDDLPVWAYEISAVDLTGNRARTTASASRAVRWILLRCTSEAAAEPQLDVHVTDRFGNDVAGAEVECAGSIRGRPLLEVTNEKGIALFKGLTAQGWWVVQQIVSARHALGMARAVVYFDAGHGRPSRHVTNLVLAAAGSLEVRVHAPPSSSAAGTIVEAWATNGNFGSWSTGVAEKATVDADGVARIAMLPVGTYSVLAWNPAGLRQDIPNRPPRWQGDVENLAPPEVKVESGQVTTADVALRAGGSIRGRVVRAPEGVPVASAHVRLQLPQGNGDGDERARIGGIHVWRLDAPSQEGHGHPLTNRMLTTDAEGRYAADGLPLGAWRVLILPTQGLSFDRKDPVDISDGKTSEVEHQVHVAGVLEAVVKPFGTYALAPAGKALEAAFVAPWGAAGGVSIPGLSAGRWELYAAAFEPRFSPIPLASFEIRAGETTFLDAGGAGNDEIRVRVLAEGRPATNALVDPTFGWAAMPVDAEGRCSWRRTKFGPISETSVLVRFDPASPWLSRGLANTDQEVDLSAPPGSLLVRTLGLDHRPVRGAKVTLERAERRQARADWVMTHRGSLPGTDDDGALRVPHLPAGSYSVQVRFPVSRAIAFGVAEVEGGSAEILLQEPRSKPIRVRVLDVEGRPQPDAVISASVEDKHREEHGMSGGTYHPWILITDSDVRTGADGAVEIPGVPYGQVGIGAQLTDSRGDAVRLRAGTSIEVGDDAVPEVVLKLIEMKDRR